MSQLKSISFTGALVLASIQAACLDDGLPPDDVGAAAQAETGSGSGSGSGSSTCDPAPDPCRAHCGWSCAPNPAPGQGRYPAPKTSGWGTITHSYRLRATKYSVTWAGGWHTGVGFTHSQKSEAETMWCEDTNGDGTGDTTKSNRTTTGPSPEAWDSTNYNHGRTVLTGNLGQSSVNTTVEYTTGGKQPLAYETSMLACIGIAETDGFCDRMCGNDAYTVPDWVKNDNDDPHPTDVMPFSNRMKYGASATPDPARWSHLWDATVWPLVHYRVPRYGHNSNNDADAQKSMMAQCNTFRAWLDGAYDVMVSPAAQCEPDWAAIGRQLDSHIAAVCSSQCGGLRLSTYSPTPTGDRNVAKSSSTLAAVDGSSVVPQPAKVKCMQAGNYREGAWPYTVCGM